MNGILVIDKPIGCTSRDVVNVVARKFHIKKVGHTGTLDPMATGVLVLCLGDYTKFVSHIINHDKKYIATITFGMETDTLDITGEVLKKSNVIPKKSEIEYVLKQYIGPQKQEVPIYSAKKIKGKKLYEYARNHESVSLPVSDIEVFDLKLLEFDGSRAQIFCSVSKGTYIRSLLRDIAHACGTVGVMSDLCRTQVGTFDIQHAFSLEDLKNDQYELLTYRDILEYETYELNEKEYFLVSHGNELKLSFSSSYLLLTYHDEEMALYFFKQGTYRPILRFDK